GIALPPYILPWLDTEPGELTAIPVMSSRRLSASCFNHVINSGNERGVVILFFVTIFPAVSTRPYFTLVPPISIANKLATTLSLSYTDYNSLLLETSLNHSPLFFNVRS